MTQSFIYQSEYKTLIYCIAVYAGKQYIENVITAPCYQKDKHLHPA